MLEAMDLHPLGDRAIIIQLGASIDEATHRRVRAVCALLDQRPVAGMIEYVPAFASVTVHYDPARLSPPTGDHAHSPYTHMRAALAEALRDLDEEHLPPPRVVEIPVSYGGAFGPDIEEVARLHDLSPDEVVQIHTAGDYLVYMIGFVPGFAYLGGRS